MLSSLANKWLPNIRCSNNSSIIKVFCIDFLSSIVCVIGLIKQWRRDWHPILFFIHTYFLLGQPVFFMRPSHRSFGNAKDSLSPANATFYFLSGVAAVFMAYSIYSNVKSFRERNAVYTSRRKREVMRQEANKRVEDCTFVTSYS